MMRTVNHCKSPPEPFQSGRGCLICIAPKFSLAQLEEEEPRLYRIGAVSGSLFLFIHHSDAEVHSM